MSFSADGNASEIRIAFVKVAGFSVPVPAPNISLLKPPLAARMLRPTKYKLIETERQTLPEAMMALLGGPAAADPVSAQGSIDVARYGRPMDARTLVGVRGAGRVHDGLWYVRSVTSTLGRGSWKQSFQLSREGLVSSLSSVPL
jgi:hypothetical protein